MSGLQLQLLGGFKILFDGSPVAGFHQPRRQSLLAHIVLNRQAPQSRSSIAFLFWPDSTDQQARTNLRRLLYSLRRALPQADRYLALTTETIQWRNDAAFLLDVAQFEAYLEQASDAGGRWHSREALKEAVSAYAGDLLPGFYEEWIVAERERLRSLYARALTQLCALHEAQRAYGAAIDVARRLLQHDAVQESTYRLLMRLHLLNGDRAAALAVYHRCTTMLREELGVDPSPLTEELYQRVLELEAAARDTPYPSQPGVSLPLVGRNQEWEQLDRVWRKAQMRSPATLLLIQGEAGIGKTRLAEELVQTARRQGMVALHTRAYAVQGAGPYSPLIDLLRSAGHPAALAKLEPAWLVELARLLPELRSGRADIPEPKPMTDAWQRQRFHEALARGVLVAGRPLLIHFDDLQWSDPQTIAWLRFLLAYDRRAGLLVVGTVRDDEIEASHPLNRLRYDLGQKGQCQVIALNPLESDEVAQLAAEVVGKALPPALAGRLFAESEGNPLFLVEALRAESVKGANRGTGRLEGDAAAIEGVERGLPPKVQAVIRWRLAQLAPEARQLAATAAVIGRRFSHELLASVSELPNRGLIRCLDELWQRRIIREDEAGTYDFSHDRLREVAYAQISPVQRRYLHRRVANALQSEHVADFGPVAGRIAHHYEQADDSARARPFLEQAGQYAAGQFANEEAARYFGQALELARQEEAPGEELAALYARLGRALELDAQVERAMEYYRQMESAARQRGNQAMLLASQVAQVTLLATPTAVHDPGQGEVLAEQTLALARRLEDQAAEARILWNRLLIYGFTHRFSEAIASGECALALARKLNLREQMAFLLNDLGYRCYRQLGRLKRAKEVLQEASELWRELGNLPMLADSLSSLCTVCVDAGEYEPALVYSEEAHRISEATGNLWGQAYSLFAIGWVHWEHGRADRAIAAMEVCIRLGEMAGFLGAQTYTRVILSLLFTDLGADEKSMETIRQAVSVAESQFPAVRLFALVKMAQLYLIQGRLADAEATIAQVKEAPNWNERVLEPTRFAEASLALRQHKYQRALVIAKALLTEQHQSETRRNLPEILYLNGRIRQAVGESDVARDCLREARAAAEALGSRRMLWRILFALSRLENDPLEVQRLQRQAREIVEFIADHTGSPELRASFLDRSRVREVLTE